MDAKVPEIKFCLCELAFKKLWPNFIIISKIKPTKTEKNLLKYSWFLYQIYSSHVLTYVTFLILVDAQLETRYLVYASLSKYLSFCNFTISKFLIQFQSWTNKKDQYGVSNILWNQYSELNHLYISYPLKIRKYKKDFVIVLTRSRLISLINFKIMPIANHSKKVLRRVLSS
jgi:hypothetical protein